MCDQHEMTTGNDSVEGRLSKAKQALSIIVEQFENREENLEPLNDFDNIFARPDVSADENRNPDILAFVRRLQAIVKTVVFIQRIFGAKVRSIASGARSSLDSENLLVLSYCTRALFEHWAAAVWLAEKLEEFSRSLENNSNPKLIEDSFRRIEGFLYALYYNKDGDPNFIHISSMLKSLSRRVVDQKNIYAKLCDYLHPNYGSNLLVSSGDIGRGVINPNVLWRIDEAIYLASLAIRAIDEVSQTIEETDSRVIHFVSLLDIASKPSTSISKWFSVRYAKPEGDGKSKETALRFRKARSKIESMSMLYKFLKAEGLEVMSCSIVAIEGDWIFETLKTTRGLIWFCSPTKFGS